MLKIKLDIWGHIWVFYDVFVFVQKATVFVAYPIHKYAPILLKFKPLPSKNYRCTPVKQNWAML